MRYIYFSFRDLNCAQHSSVVPQHEGMNTARAVLAMAFAQLAYRESLRYIEACLVAIGPKLYHLGFGSALADAN